MQDSYVEGLATHNGPESCGATREGGDEALTGGTSGPGIQPRKKSTSGCRRCKEKRKAASGAPISRGATGSRAVRDPAHARKHLAREPGDPLSIRGSPCFGSRREV